MADRESLVKKIEDELRKPKVDQNVELLTFWKEELARLPIIPTHDGKGLNLFTFCFFVNF